MRVRLKVDVWNAMPIGEFVPKMRELLRAHPKVLHEKEFSELLHRERVAEIRGYVEAEGRKP